MIHRVFQKSVSQSVSQSHQTSSRDNNMINAIADNITLSVVACHFTRHEDHWLVRGDASRCHICREVPMRKRFHKVPSPLYEGIRRELSDSLLALVTQRPILTHVENDHKRLVETAERRVHEWLGATRAYFNRSSSLPKTHVISPTPIFNPLPWQLLQQPATPPVYVDGGEGESATPPPPPPLSPQSSPPSPCFCFICLLK